MAAVGLQKNCSRLDVETSSWFGFLPIDGLEAFPPFFLLFFFLIFILLLRTKKEGEGEEEEEKEKKKKLGKFLIFSLVVVLPRIHRLEQTNCPL